MNNDKISGQFGFTLAEMAIILAVIAIISAISIPNIMGWIARGRVNSAVMNIVALIQKARIEAVRKNTEAVIIFDLASGKYTSFVDDGHDGGIPCNGLLDGGERLLHTDTLPPGVMFSSVSLGLSGNRVSFNSRAIPKMGGGSIVLTGARNNKATIRLGTGGIPTIER